MRLIVIWCNFFIFVNCDNLWYHHVLIIFHFNIQYIDFQKMGNQININKLFLDHKFEPKTVQSLMKEM